MWVMTYSRGSLPLSAFLLLYNNGRFHTVQSKTALLSFKFHPPIPSSSPPLTWWRRCAGFHPCPPPWWVLVWPRGAAHPTYLPWKWHRRDFPLARRGRQFPGGLRRAWNRRRKWRCPSRSEDAAQRCSGAARRGRSLTPPGKPLSRWVKERDQLHYNSTTNKATYQRWGKERDQLHYNSTTNKATYQRWGKERDQLHYSSTTNKATYQRWVEERDQLHYNSTTNKATYQHM